jgi:L-ascorbate 6-phosphate lactonase
MNLVWLGQGGFIFEQDGCRLVIDPYLSDCLAARGFARSFPSPVGPAHLHAYAIVCTHDHGDHFDPDSVLPAVEARPETTVLGPPSVVKHGAELGLTVEALPSGHTATALGPFRLRTVPAHHSDPDAVGLIVEVDGLRIYLTGDTTYAEDLAPAALACGPIDLLLICINGKLGNMTAKEAVKVTAAIRPRLAIPMHYGMFPVNTADPQTFLAPVRELGIDARELPLAAPVPLLLSATLAQLAGEGIGKSQLPQPWTMQPQTI